MIKKDIVRFETNQRELKKIVDFIYAAKGIDLATYRQTFIYRRLWSRMFATKSLSYGDYEDLLKSNPSELDRLIDAISINVSEFFRNPDVFTAFRKIALSNIIRRKEETGNKTIRIWSAGCSTGQETYSIAILVSEELKDRKDFTVRIWGTDVDSDALEKAKKAEYAASLLKDVDKEILEKYFVLGYNGLYKLNDKIRRMANFEKNNLITEPPLKYMDAIFCRNMMIYLTRQQQEILFKKFHYSLKNGGYLVIGQVEAIWDRDLFNAVDLRRKIYEKA